MKKIFILGIVAAAFCGMPALAAPPAVPMFNWTGFYAGMNAGYGWGSATSFVQEVAGLPPMIPPVGQFGPGFFPATVPISQNGFAGGGQIGYNFQMNNVVLGLESDIQYADIRGSKSVNGTTLGGFPLLPQPDIYTITQKVDWFGTTRARVGFTAGERTLIYGTAGVAYARVSASSNFWYIPSNVSEVGTSSAVKSGWTVGAGIESLVAPNWTLKFEYLYYDLGTLSVLTDSNWVGVTEHLKADFPIHGSIARVGLNYKFN